MEKRLKYKLIVNGLVPTKQDEATIDKLIEQYSLEQVDRAIDELITNKKPLSELTISEVKTFNENEEVKECAKAIVIYACAKKQTIEEFTKRNHFEDMDNETFSEAVDYINNHRQELENLYAQIKWW